MRLRVAVFATFVGALAIFAGTAAPGAQAFADPPPYQQLTTEGRSSSLWGAFKSLVGLQPSSTTTAYGTLIGGETPTTQAGIKSMLYRAGVRGRFLPVLGTAATRLTLVGTAGYIGWRIYKHYSGDSPVAVDVWIDGGSLGADALYNPCAVPDNTFPFPNYDQAATPCSAGLPQYQWVGVAWAKETGSNCTPVGGGDCFALRFFPCFHHSGCLAPNAFYSVEISGQIGYPDPEQYTVERILDIDDCLSTALPHGIGCYQAAVSGATNGNSVYGMAYMVTRTAENLAGRVYSGESIVDDQVTVPIGSGYTVGSHRLVIGATGLGPDAGVTANSGNTLTTPDLTTDYTVPNDAGDTDADAQAMLEPFDNPCGRALINHLLEPNFYPWVPGCIETAPAEEPEADVITVLRPLSTETYTDYITRLQAEGWVGTATLIELDPYDPTIGPEAVSKVGVTGTSGTWRRSLWPSTWPQVASDTDLTIYHNPDTAPPVAPDPTDEESPPGGGDVFDPGGCEPWLEAEPDFSPLTGLSFGTKFPFGLFGWVAGALAVFDVTPEAPSWSFAITIPATSVSSAYELGNFDVDLEAFSPYMADVRLVLSFVLWLGAAWYFATALLGLRAPGNPAEAVDEA